MCFDESFSFAPFNKLRPYSFQRMLPDNLKRCYSNALCCPVTGAANYRIADAALYTKRRSYIMRHYVAHIRTTIPWRTYVGRNIRCLQPMDIFSQNYRQNKPDISGILRPFDLTLRYALLPSYCRCIIAPQADSTVWIFSPRRLSYSPIHGVSAPYPTHNGNVTTVIHINTRR